MWITVEFQNSIVSFECKKVVLARVEAPAGPDSWAIGFYDESKYPVYRMHFDNEQDAKFKYDVVLAEIAGQTLRLDQKDAYYIVEGMNY